MNRRLLYSNKDAIDMFPAIGTGKGKPLETIYGLCNDLRKNRKADEKENGMGCGVLHDDCGAAYSVRAFFIGDPGKDKASTHIMVLIERVIEKREPDFQKAAKQFGLTKREGEVVRLVCSGMTNREISEELFVSEHTVKSHIKNLMKKTGISSRAGIIAQIK
ncbi:MAG: helix-turn-helix transcriptional regulator [Deltaproteobacteria bacterium]|nr:helix-turn-helix transcriptional regulator [Deltaproteobacteria bacterium]